MSQDEGTITDHQAQARPASRCRWTFNSRFLIGAPGNPMMERWRLIQTPLFGIYVHRIYREDLDPVPHDHPWRFWSLILRGGYREEYSDDARYHLTSELKTQRRWTVHAFPLRACHRIVSVEPRTVTLVVVGRKTRTYGQHQFEDGECVECGHDEVPVSPDKTEEQ